jgi:hypothetical protein
VSACKIIGPLFHEEIIKSDHHFQLILTPFFRELIAEDKMYSYFMQNNAMTFKTNFSMTALEQVFGKWLITHRLWSPTSPDLNLCKFCFIMYHATSFMATYVNR